MLLNQFILKWWSPLDESVGGEKLLTGAELFNKVHKYAALGYEIEVCNVRE